MTAFGMLNRQERWNVIVPATMALLVVTTRLIPINTRSDVDIVRAPWRRGAIRRERPWSMMRGFALRFRPALALASSLGTRTLIDDPPSRSNEVASDGSPHWLPDRHLLTSASPLFIVCVFAASLSAWLRTWAITWI